MKILKILLIVLISCNFINCNSKKQLKEKWINLKNSNNEQTEIKRIEKLSDFIFKINGHFRMNGITQNNDTLNLITQRTDSVKLSHINMIINWKNNSYHAKNWKPVNLKNIYLFFRE